MTWKPLETIWAIGTINKDGTGLVDDDSLPVGTVYRNGADTGVTVTVTRISLGTYKLTATLGSYSAGDDMQLKWVTTVDGVTQAEVLVNAIIDTVRASEVAEDTKDAVLSNTETWGVTTIGGKIQAAGAAADPWAKTLAQLALYDAETAARLWVKLNVGEADDTVIVVPAAPTTANKCRVYGYMEDPSGAVAANVDIVFELQAPVPTKGNKLIAGRKITVTTDSQGRISDGTNAWQEFNRNDLLTPAGTYYKVRCKELRMDLPIYLDDTTFNLATMVTELSGAGVISTTDRSNRWVDHPDIADQEGGTPNKVLYVYDSTDSGLAGLYRWSLDEVQPADGVDYIDATSGGQWVIVVHF